MKLLIAILLFTATALAADFQHGKLVSVTDSTSTRTYGTNGNVNTAYDVEYRISIELDGMVYVGSYYPRWRWSYSPTDFIVNDPVEVRIDGNHLVIKRPNGKELKTAIVRRIRKDQAGQ